VDVMLGAIALTTGVRTLETYKADLLSRGQTETRIQNVHEALQGLSDRISRNDQHNITLHIKGTVGDAKFTCSQGLLVRELKYLIEDELLLPVSKQNLTFNKIQLVNSMTLFSYHFAQNTVLALSQIMFAFGEGSPINKITFDLHWGYPPSGQDYLDGSCLVYDVNGNYVTLLDYNHKDWHNHAIAHSGDVMTATTGHHTISVTVKALPANIKHLFFTLSAWNAPKISYYPNPGVVLSEASAPTEQLCEYSISKASDLQAVIMCCMTKKEDGWVIEALGTPSAGNAKDYSKIKQTITGAILSKHH